MCPSLGSQSNTSSSFSTIPSEQWIYTSVSMVLKTSEQHPIDHQQCIELVEIPELYSYTRLAFYVSVDPVPSNLSLTVQLGEWTRKVLLLPSNCSFRGWVDVDFKVSWNYPPNTLLVKSLIVQASLAEKAFDVQGYVTRLMFRSYEVIPLTGKRQELLLSPQNQSRTLDGGYSWLNQYIAITQGQVCFPATQKDIRCTLEVNVQWIGLKDDQLIPTIRVKIGDQTWQRQTAGNGSIAVTLEGTFSSHSMAQEEVLTISLELSHLRGKYVNIHFQAFLTLEEVTQEVTAPVGQTVLFSFVSPTLLITMTALVGGLWGSKIYYARKWQQNQASLEHLVRDQLHP